MAINGYFFNAVLEEGVYDRIYNAEDMTSYLAGIVGNGVFPNPSTNLQVRAGTGMQVIVAPGAGWINGHKIVNTSDAALTIAASDVLLTRIDAVIFYCDLTTRSMGLDVKTGTPSANPTAPAMTRSETRYEMCLARVKVDKQITAITGGMLTDTRMNSSVCGVVQGLIQQIDTTTLWDDEQAKFREWMESVQTEFDQFKVFKKLEAVYTTQAESESTFNVTTLIPTYSFAYDILEVYINGFHLTTNDYTLVNGVVTLTIPIVKPGAVLDFVVYHLENPDT